MADKPRKGFGDTIVIRRPKVKTDERGRTVWVGDVDSAELELVNTVTLEKILKSDDQAKREIQKVAEKGEEGVLVRDTATGLFEVLDPESIEPDILEQTGYRRRHGSTKSEEKLAEPELSLVDTNVLDRLLADEELELQDKNNDDPDDSGGYDPYNSA